jgi:hypothetical protein
MTRDERVIYRASVAVLVAGVVLGLWAFLMAVEVVPPMPWSPLAHSYQVHEQEGHPVGDVPPDLMHKMLQQAGLEPREEQA